LWALRFLAFGKNFVDPYLSGGFAMRRFPAALLVLTLVAVNSRDAAAQPTAQDAAAAVALTFTPVGTFTPIMMQRDAVKGFTTVAGRFGMYSPSAGDGNTSLGASGFFRAGSNALISGTLGYTMVGCPSGDCDNGMLLGADMLSQLWTSAGNTGTNFSLNFHGAAGFSSFGDASFTSLALGAPLSMSMEQASKARLSFHVTPGFGWGRMAVDVSGTSMSESGTRPMFSLGGAWVAPAGWGVHVGFQQIMIENGGNTIGAGFSWKMN
jgi:hypothetical protein